MRSEKEVRKEFEELETKLMNSAKEYFKSKKQKESFSKYKTFFKLWDRYGGDEPLTYFSSDDGFGEDIGEYFALNWMLEGKPRYSVEEIPIPKAPCIVVFEEIDYETLDMIAKHPSLKSWSKGILITNKKTFVSEPRFTIAELEKIVKSKIKTELETRKRPYDLDEDFVLKMAYGELFELLKDKKKVGEILNEK